MKREGEQGKEVKTEDNGHTSLKRRKDQDRENPPGRCF